MMIIRFLLIFSVSVSLFSDIEINDTLHSDTNSYTVVRKVRQGAFGTIFELVDSQQSHFVLKSYFESVSYPEAERSYHVGRQLTHPHILQVIDLVQHNDIKYCVFAFIDGVTLEEVPSLLPQETLRICHQWIDALLFAFSHQFMNIDVNGSNIMIDASNHATIVDLDSFVHIEQMSDYAPIFYFDKVITDMCIHLIQKTTLERVKKIAAQSEIKKLAWEYIEDAKEGKEASFATYILLLLDRLSSVLSP